MKWIENDQREGGRGIVVERRRRGWSKNLHAGPSTMDNSKEIFCGNGGVGWVEEGKGRKIGTTVTE